MFFKTVFVRFGLVFAFTAALGCAVFGDTIRLKDGSLIKGKIVSFGGGKFTVVIADGERERRLDFSAAEVESISFDAGRGDNLSSKQVKYAGNLPVSNAPAATATTTTTTTPAPVQSSAPKVVNQPTGQPAASNSSSIKPISLNVSVLADSTSNGWTNSGFVVRKGQKIRIDCSGKISLGGGRYTTSEGIATLTDANKLMPKEATGGLIAVVGDDNNDFIFIGAGREFTATRDGALFLGVNEGNLEDNSGRYDVKIGIYPN